jgi:Repeat of unknown function (DUF5907)
MAITHAKTNNIADWTQVELDAQIKLGRFPIGTLLADIVLPSDWNDDHAGGADYMAVQIMQVAHGFSIGEVLYYDGLVYARANADDVLTSDVVGIVSEVIDADNFSLATGGMISGIAGLSPGSVYFLSDTVAGALTLTEPTTVDHVSKPLLMAVSESSGVFVNYRGIVAVDAVDNMSKAVYDPAGIEEQLVGLTATQSMTGKTVNGVVLTTAGVATKYLDETGVYSTPGGGGGGTGDVVGPASATDNAVTRYDTTTGKLIQNSVVLISDTGAVTGVTTLGASGAITGSNLSGTNTGDQTITLTGDVTGSGTSSFAATIANDAVTYAKMQNISAASKLLGRGDSGSGDAQEITIGANLTMTGTTLSASGGGSGITRGQVHMQALFATL